MSEIRPVITARTVAAARPALRGSRSERWEKVASGAAGSAGARWFRWPRHPRSQPFSRSRSMARGSSFWRRLASGLWRQSRQARARCFLSVPPGLAPDGSAARVGGFRAAASGRHILRWRRRRWPRRSLRLFGVTWAHPDCRIAGSQAGGEVVRRAGRSGAISEERPPTERALGALAGIRPSINRFFDHTALGRLPPAEPKTGGTPVTVQGKQKPYRPADQAERAPSTFRRLCQINRSGQRCDHQIE